MATHQYRPDVWLIGYITFIPSVASPICGGPSLVYALIGYITFILLWIDGIIGAYRGAEHINA